MEERYLEAKTAEGNMPELPKRQSEVYEVIKSYQAKHGYPPTQEEIAGELSLSRETVRDYLNIIEKKGYINRSNSRRLIEITA
jgi:SOS-response transcriptional repressor LexA